MNYKKITFYGFLIWFIPFMISFPFFNKAGEILIDRTAFNVFITVVLIFVFSFFLWLYLKSVDKDFRKNTIVFGLTAFFVSVFADLFVLVGLLTVTLYEYFIWTLPAYLNILIITILVERVIEIVRK
ncbi:MAG: hypothetical protein OXU73_02020 [Candidatus Campbellbacteria bacterium]|nr:hypothetical protein [Candidatus Campbellbacteria bacterium]